MNEQTLILLKPDAIQRGLIGKIVERIEQKEFKIVAMKMVKPDQAIVGRHYTADLEWLQSVGNKTLESYAKKGIKVNEKAEDIGHKVRDNLMKALQGQPIIAMVVEGYHAVEIIRKIVGSTEPRQSAPGTIRGDYSVDSYALGDANERPVKNLIHASDSVPNAKKEIAVWFSENDITDYNKPNVKAAH